MRLDADESLAERNLLSLSEAQEFLKAMRARAAPPCASLCPYHLEHQEGIEPIGDGSDAPRSEPCAPGGGAHCGPGAADPYRLRINRQYTRMSM